MNGALVTHHRKTPKNPASLTSRVEQCLRDHGPATTGALADLMKTSKSHISNAMATLRKARRAHTVHDYPGGDAMYAYGPKPNPTKSQANADVIDTSIARPRQVIGSGPLELPAWQPPRAGTSQQELRIPSRGPCGVSAWVPPRHGCVGRLKESADQGRG